MRTLQAIIDKFGDPVFKIRPNQDKTMSDKSIHYLIDIPKEVMVFLRPENPQFTPQFHKYIAFSIYESDKYIYHQDANEMIVKYFLDQYFKQKEKQDEE